MNIKKIRAIKIVIIVLMVAVVGYIAYPFVTNIPAYFRRDSALSEWDDIRQNIQAEDTGEPLEEPENETEALGPDETDFTVDIANFAKTLGTSVENDRNKFMDRELVFPLKIVIPKIEMEEIVYDNVDVETLKKGPGHIPQTPLYGQFGRFTISGHRTTYGAHFNKIDRLEAGDLINIETLEGQNFVYAVTETVIVKPTEVEILQGTMDRKELLLTSCYPEYSARERIVVIAQLLKVYPFEIEKLF